MKNFPADFDHLVDDYNKEISPTLSRRTTRTNTEGGGGIPLGGMQHSPSLHSLGVLGLRPVPPPVPEHGAPSGPPSIAPSLAPTMMMKSLPPTPALSQRGLLQGEITPNVSQRGLVVGPGETPNGAGPFVNAGQEFLKEMIEMKINLSKNNNNYPFSFLGL